MSKHRARRILLTLLGSACLGLAAQLLAEGQHVSVAAFCLWVGVQLTVAAAR